MDARILSLKGMSTIDIGWKSACYHTLLDVKLGCIVYKKVDKVYTVGIYWYVTVHFMVNGVYLFGENPITGIGTFRRFWRNGRTLFNVKIPIAVITALELFLVGLSVYK